MLREGYAAVTSRRVASEAGIKPQLVHYYFRTMDDLFLEVYRRRAEESIARFAAVAGRAAGRCARSGDSPPSYAARPSTSSSSRWRTTARRSATRSRATRNSSARCSSTPSPAILDDLGVSPESFPPVVVMLAMTGVSQVMALEAALGVTEGHDEMMMFVDSWLDEAEPDRAEGVHS